MSAAIDLTGKRVGKLSVIKVSEERKGKKLFWECICDCGKKAVVSGDKLRYGLTRSCGCLRANNGRLTRFRPKHGISSERVYNVWHGMISRCENKNHEHYPYYGGRGIKVCDEWHDPNVFKTWALEHGYDPDAKQGMTTIDRIDTNGNYEPGNCRIVDMKFQSNNRRKRRCYRLDDRERDLQSCS